MITNKITLEKGWLVKINYNNCFGNSGKTNVSIKVVTSTSLKVFQQTQYLDDLNKQSVKHNTSIETTLH